MPAVYGGQEADFTTFGIAMEEIGRGDFSCTYGLQLAGLAGEILGKSGTEEIKARWLPPTARGEAVVALALTEPGAGSDAAGLACRAERDGDEFVVNGQKTWNSWGQWASWCGVLARTEPPETKHRGISFLIADMASPGIEARPMTQITGHAEFCELFFDDVRVPMSNLLGERGQGWQIALHTLSHERSTAALPRQVKLRTWVDRLVAEARTRAIAGRTLLDHEDTQVALARALINVEVLRHHASRTVGRFLSGEPIGPESSSVKLVMAEAEQLVGTTALEVVGASLDAPADQTDDEANAFWHETYLYSRSASILGGTEQIQRNIIAERVLQLPQG
jgi:alkylation response protein AidB-like acyl-CoA dehydrogenase